MPGEQLDIDFARAARDEGIKRASEHAGPKWIDLAVADLVRFLKERGEAPSEQWRFDWLSRKQPEPPTHKVWGGVTMAAARRKLIVKTGRSVQARSPKTHGHHVPVWRAA